MAKRQFVDEGQMGRNHVPRQNVHGGRCISRRRGLVGVGAIALVFCWTTNALANTGPGIGLKVGAQTLDSPIDGQKTTRVRIEAEVATALMADEHLDFFLSVGGSPLGKADYADIYEAGGVFYEDYYSDTFSLIDVRLGARLYPLGQESSIRPHIGGGIGYYWLMDSYDDEYYATTEDPYFPGRYITYADYANSTDTVADGFFPFITAGVTVPVTSNIEVLFEFEYDFAKDDSGVDVGGPIYMFGARIRI